MRLFGTGRGGTFRWELVGAPNAQGHRERQEWERRRDAGELPAENEDHLPDWLTGLPPSPERVYEPPAVIDDDTHEFLGSGPQSLSKMLRPAGAGESSEPWPSGIDDPKVKRSTHETHDLTCQRCKRAGRHASVQIRDSDLQLMLNQVSANGHTTITPEFIAAWLNRRHNTPR
ncbi:hypothetical protein [Yimella lutea]|uniref:hypothetical protein n=1 Tax=Yimella lutea TaxID=587872 RepID=UPI00114D764D|nr:hypothetical protein [Yimella lutea]